MVINKGFQIPKDRANTIFRPRLAEQLSFEDQTGLVLISAPAGYGKSTLAHQSLVHNSHLSWYMLEDYDNDPEPFFLFFVHAIKAASRHPFPNTEDLLQNSTYTIKKLFSTFINEFLSITQPCSIVLDNYHKISHKRIHDFFRQLLSHFPKNLTLYIISRQLPPFNLAQLQLQGKLRHINKLQLMFTKAETREFINAHYPNLTISPDKSQELYHFSQGWISPIILLLDTARDDYALLNLINNKSTHLNFPSIDQYIEDEILKTLPHSVVKFCMNLACFSVFTERQAITIYEEIKARKHLEELLKSGLLSVVSNEKNQFTLHPIVRDYLNVRRLKHFPKNETELSRKITQAYLEEESIEEAIELVLTNDQEELLINILKKYGWDLFNQFKLDLLEKACTALTERALIQNHSNVLLAAWVANTKGNSAEVNRLINLSEQLLNSLMSKSVISELSGQINVLKAQQAISHHQPETALQYAESALINLDHASYRGRCIATSIIGEIHHINGKLEQALSLMQQTERFARQHKLPPQIIRALIQQSEIYFTQGMLSLCEDILHKTEEIIHQHSFFNLSFYPLFISLQMELYQEKKDFKQARKIGLNALKRMTHTSNPKDLIYAALAKIDISQKQWSDTRNTLANLSMFSEAPSPDWSTYLSETKLYYWKHTQNNLAITQWLDLAREPELGCNHLTQCQYRNMALSCLVLSDYEQSEHLLNKSINYAKNSHLILDLYRSYTLRAYLFHCQNRKNLAIKSLVQSLSLSAEYKIQGYYYLIGKWILTYLNEIATSNKSVMTRTELWHVNKLKEDLETYYLAENASSYCSVDKLIAQITHYQQEQGNPVTPREAQIFSLIYTGWKNEQIAEYCKVAPSTIKTHIRNLYQKLSVSNRRQAKTLAAQLMDR